MSVERELMERQLLAKPFDAELRERYASLLFDQEAWRESLEQWLLLAGQQAGRAEPHLAAALCSMRLGDEPAAAKHAERARDCDDFDEQDPRLAELPEERARRMRVVQGERQDVPRGEVVSIGSTETIRFADVVGMEDLKKVLKLRIIEPFVNPGLFQRFKKRSGGGVLLYGPPGCGKTMMARAIATECKAEFNAVGIAEILSMWHGQSEENLAAIFQKARDEAPSVLFFDELDALAYSRSKASSDMTRTLVNEFLGQLDGMSGDNDRVLILAATNMPWDVDEAMKRPGRFDRQVFVPPPDHPARAEMFRTKLVGVPVGEIDWSLLGRAADHFSGADVDGVIERAKEAVLGEILEGADERPIGFPDLKAAIEATTPSTLEWLKTARNLVKFGGAGRSYKDVERYLRSVKLY